jgi:hypothetical protein
VISLGLTSVGITLLESLAVAGIAVYHAAWLVPSDSR